MEFLLSASSQLVTLYTILFVVYSILEITGALPQEMRSAGITLPALFSGYYGHEVARSATTVHMCCGFAQAHVELLT